MEHEKFKQGRLGTVNIVQGLKLNTTVFASDLAIALCHGPFGSLKLYLTNSFLLCISAWIRNYRP